MSTAHPIPTEPTIAHPAFGPMKLRLIDESPTNPRGEFDKDALAELAASIKDLGVLQPVMVRPMGERFELVFGHRRFRAAKLVGLKEIPVIIRDLDEREVLEAQLCENLKRQDLSAVEEADGYQRLKSEFNLTVEAIAKKVGKSKASVYARMKLADLSPAARKLVHDKRVDASVALLAARMPSDKLQEKFLKDATTPEREDLPLWSYREAARHAREDYMVDLDKAQFDTTDEALLPPVVLRQGDEYHMGSCRGCPMRTGNQRDLFTDVKDADVCTSPKCFRAKQDAHWAKVKSEAKAQGIKVLEGPETKGLWAQHAVPGCLSYKSGYISLENVAHGGGGNKRYADLLKGKAVEGRVLAIDQAGFIQEIMRPEALHAALKEIGYKRLADEHLVEVGEKEEADGKRAKPDGDDFVDPSTNPRVWTKTLRGKPASKAEEAAEAPPPVAANREPPRFAHPKKDSLATWCPFCETGVELERDGGPDGCRKYHGKCGCCHAALSMIATDEKTSQEIRAQTKASMDRMFGVPKDVPVQKCERPRCTELVINPVGVPPARLCAKHREEPPGPETKDDGKRCGLVDGKSGEPCFKDVGHESTDPVHSNGGRTWKDKKTKCRLCQGRTELMFRQDDGSFECKVCHDLDRGPVIDVKPGESDEAAESRYKKKRATK